MKKTAKIIIWGIAVFLVILVALNIVFAVSGKTIITSQIEQNLKLKARLDKLTVSLPLNISLNNLEIEGLIKADTISFSPSVLGFLAGKVVLDNLIISHPEITLVKDSEGKLNIPELESKGKQPPVLLTGLKINNGKFIFLDKKISPEGYKITVDKINVNISKVVFPPTSLYTNFNLSAVLLDSASSPAGSAALTGWIDFGPKNMDGNLELMDVAAASLAPYFKSMLPVKKLLSSRLNFKADLKAQNNDLTAKCHAEIIRQIEADKGESSASLVPNVLNLFSDDSGKIAFDFTINTKLDKPKIDLLNLKGTVGQAAVENITSQSPEKVIEKVKDTIEQFKDFGKNFKDIFKKKKEE